MPFQVLFDDSETAPTARYEQAEASDKPAKVKKPRSKAVKVEKPRGCEVCPLNKPELVKIMGTTEGKDIVIFTQSPGPDDNDEGRLLVGAPGKWLWKELARVGIQRKDVDVQSATRCMPADVHEGTYETTLKMRNPSAEELRCCSIHTEKALERIKPKHVLLLGQVAAKAVLRSRSMPATKIFWSDELQAKVYLLDHPSFFLRGYGNGARLDAFRQLLDILAQDRMKSGKTLSDRFAFVRSQDYRLVLNKKQALEALADLAQYRGKRRIATDIEDDEFDGRRRIFACGFSPKVGLSYVFVFKHKDQKPEDGEAVREAAIQLLTTEGHKFAYHYGCSDVTKWLEYEGVKVKGFTHDTLLSEYLRFSDRKAYGLEATAEARFPEFSGYKLITTKDMLQGGVDKFPRSEDGKPTAYEKILLSSNLEAQYKFVEKNKLLSFKNLSLDTLRVYNGADCDLTKRIEISNRKEISDALMKLYIDLSFLLYKMELNGPLFDYKQCEQLSKLYPWKEKRLKRKLRKILGDKTYNPGSPPQVLQALFYTLALEFPYPDQEPNTRKKPLTLMAREHEFPRLQLEWRVVSKVKTTYLDSYLSCAKNNGGRLRTRWWATGTRTGRLSSGGGRRQAGDDIKIVNLQNIKKDAQIQNMCVADTRWRKFFKAAKALEAIYKTDEALAAALEQWVREYMPDLKTYLIHDYGQVEVRVMAQMSGDENLKADCLKSDIHTAVGVTMTGWDPDKILNDEQTRTLTKNVHFGIMFGLQDIALYEFVLAMSPLDQQGKITKEEVLAGYKRYFKRYSKVKLYQVNQRTFARENRYVETLFGMKQHLRIEERRSDDDDFFEDGTKERGSYWGNQCINGPVQGTAHQLMICALVNLIRNKKKYEKLGIPPLEVHDAIYFVVNVLDLPETYELSKDMLEKESINTMMRDFPDIKWDVPIVTDAKAGIRLGCKVKLKPGFTVGKFLLDWYRECQKQNIALNAELKIMEKALAKAKAV